jgi:hypothetical protein
MIIIPKRSVILGHVPTPEQLEEGEIAINIAGGGEKIYVKNADGEIVLIGGSELFTLIKEARDHVDSSIAAHNSSSEAHSDIRDAITLTYKKEESGDILLQDAKTSDTLYPQTLETEVLDASGISLDVNLGTIRDEIDKRNIGYTNSEFTEISMPNVLDGTGLVLGEFPIPSEEVEISKTDTISSAIGKLYRMIKR